MIAALFVETGGSYFNLPDVDPWDIMRDARLYKGPHSVVAHPPCQLWGPFAAVNFARWGGEHNRPGNDQGCFASALRSVVTYGGVLEHPFTSRAWAVHGVEIPKTPCWHRHGLHEWVCQVRQSAYGHRANKATGLFYSGVRAPFDLDWSRPAGSHQIGYHDQRGKARNKPTVGKKEASATPPAFRDTLIALARHSQEK
jgi:hypothetical protein